MNAKKTILIAVLFIIVAAYYVWDQKRIKTNEARQEAESRLITPKKDALTDISIERKQGALKLEKQGGRWVITQPVRAGADETAVNSLLDEIDRAKKTNPFDAKGKPEDFGLKDPSIKAEFKAAGANYIQNVELGSKTTAGDEVYAQIPKDKKIFTVSTSLETQLSKSANELRDKRLLPANLNEATSLTLSFDGLVFEMEKKEGKWELLKPIRAKADDDKISEILREWNNAKAEDFIDTRPLNLATYGLDRPSLTATVCAKEKDRPATLTLLVGGKVPKNESMQYAMAQGGNNAFTVRSQALEKLRPTLNDLRSKELFTLKSSDVSRLIFDVRGKKTDLESDSSGKWHLANDKAARVDQSFISQKISDLINLKAVRLFDTPTSPSETGLDRPNLRITLASRDRKTTETILIGKRTGQGEGEFIYVRLVEKNLTAGVNWQEIGKFYVMRDEALDKSMFNFEEGLVQKIEIKDGAKKITFNKEKGGGWTAKAKGAAATYQIEGAKMTGLIYSMGGLKYKRRIDPKYPTDARLVKEHHLENPSREVVFYGDKGNELGRFGHGDEKEANVYVRQGMKDYYIVDKTDYASFKSSIDDVLKALEPKK
jgi:hypothetical protein